MLRGKLKSLSEAEAIQLTQGWEADGFVFEGNRFLDRDDPVECPACGEGGFFYALWEHPTRQVEEVGTDGERYVLKDARCLNHCYECDLVWADREEAQK